MVRHHSRPNRSDILRFQGTSEFRAQIYGGKFAGALEFPRSCDVRGSCLALASPVAIGKSYISGYLPFSRVDIR